MISAATERRAGIVLLALATFLLAACAAEPNGPTRGGAAVVTHPAEAARDGAGSETAPPAQSALATPPAAPAPEPAAPAVSAESLLGRSDGEIRNLLGEPQLMRREASAEVWQYRDSACVLDLVLYRQGDRARVHFLEARDRLRAEIVPSQPCLDALLKERAGKTG